MANLASTWQDEMRESGPVIHIFLIEAPQVGHRLDRWLADTLPDMSRTEVQRLIRAGDVLVNDTPAKPSYPLELGDRVEVRELTAPQEANLTAEALNITILFEDDDLIVVEKPSGMVVHPAPGHQGGTLVNALLYHCADLGLIGGERRPGIVHRLDKDTSGLMVVAKHAVALRDLQAQFKARTVFKEYLALVEGVPEPAGQTIDAPVGRHPVDRKRQAAFPPNLHQAGIRVREAITEINRLAVYTVAVRDSNAAGHFSLVAALPRTGRTHQIRVHLAWIKHPIVGDPVYGLKRPRLPVPRLFLHAHKLRFRSPSAGIDHEFVSPLPRELQSVLDSLGGQS